MRIPRITFDVHGTPGVWAATPAEAYAGMGFLHGRYRPLQSLILGCAGRGCLAERLWPRPQLVELDALVHRLDVPELGRSQAQQMDPTCAELVDAYLVGFETGLRHGGQPFELRVVCARLPGLDRAAVVSGMLVSAFLGLAQGQERMERALVDALAAGADPQLLECMFRPHLETWDPARLARLPRRTGLGMAAHGLVGVAGSNAWAMTGERSASGKPILCGDPHLQINQLPSIFFELRARVGEDFWLGATIPGLPGIAVGRNRTVAWSGTFGCADNVDFMIEELSAGKAKRSSGQAEVVVCEKEVRRRFKSSLRLTFAATDRGVLENQGADGETLAVRWTGAARASETLSAYVRLPCARSVAEAEQSLLGAHAYSLHFVLADTSGQVRTCHVGRIPRRSSGWSGLAPQAAAGPADWNGFLEGAALPRSAAVDGIIVSANEPRFAADGTALATLAQPSYRLDRITELLMARPIHDVASMQAVQLDLVSLQARRLGPGLLARLRDGNLRSILSTWDQRYTADSRGAHAFELVYDAALRSLAPRLGRDWLAHALDNSELSVWWCAGFDRVLRDPGRLGSQSEAALVQALAAIHDQDARPWGEIQQVSLGHMVFAGLPGCLGLDRGPLPLEGSIATVRQGNVLQVDGQPLAVGPAFRMVCDLATPELWTGLPGGIDGSRFSNTYTRWLSEWQVGQYHRLAPPTEDELS